MCGILPTTSVVCLLLKSRVDGSLVIAGQNLLCQGVGGPDCHLHMMHTSYTLSFTCVGDDISHSFKANILFLEVFIIKIKSCRNHVANLILGRIQFFEMSIHSEAEKNTFFLY